MLGNCPLIKLMVGGGGWWGYKVKLFRRMGEHCYAHYYLTIIVGRSKSWKWTKCGGSGIWASFDFVLLCVVFCCWRGLGGFASVGSRNALHVVGVTPVLHVVRSCTTVRAVFHYLVLLWGIMLVYSCNGYYLVLLWFLVCVLMIPR